MSTQHQQPDFSPLHLSPFTLSRRSLLFGAAGIALGACSGGTNQSAPLPTPLPGTQEAAEGIGFLQATFFDGFVGPPTIIAGQQQRITMILVAPDGLPIVNGLPDALDVVLTSPAGTEEPFSLPIRNQGIASPHYTLAWDPEDEGEYLVSATVEGEQLGFPFLVSNRDTVQLAQVGDSMRRADTPTLDNTMGFDPICTRFDPCQFHDISLNQALDAAGPTALLISTPGFCQTTSCGPVLELLIADHTMVPNLNVVHAEVYTEPQKLTEVNDRTTLINPLLSTYGMAFEPSMILADANGIITARLDYNWDGSEAKEALATLL